MLLELSVKGETLLLIVLEPLCVLSSSGVRKLILHRSHGAMFCASFCCTRNTVWRVPVQSVRHYLKFLEIFMEGAGIGGTIVLLSCAQCKSLGTSLRMTKMEVRKLEQKIHTDMWFSPLK